MSNLTEQQLLDLYEYVGQPAELAEYAASDAARQLAGNWEMALRGGDSIQTLLHDVDKVVLILQAWKAVVAQKLAD